MRYPTVIHKDSDSDYGVTVPDVPGCFSAGETIDEALIQVVEAIEAHLEGLLLDHYAAQRGETRSGLIAEATMEYIATHTAEEEAS